jgi:glycine cleavage system aminomethyltransferase T
VTSAVYSPRLEKNIALAMVELDCTDIGMELMIAMPEGPTWATVVETPFFDPNKQLASNS